MYGGKRTTKDLVRIISARTQMSQIDVSRVLEQFFYALTSELKDNNEVQLTGFGKFYNTVWAPRTVNRVGKPPMKIGSRLVTNFQISRGIKEKINNKYRKYLKLVEAAESGDTAAIEQLKLMDCWENGALKDR